MTRVILIRHGQTLWNLAMKYQGHCDIALTAAGIEQARLAAKRLAGENISAVYASDLSRAMVTAQQIAEPHKLSVTAVPQLREVNFGDWEGLTFKSLSERMQTTEFDENWSQDMLKIFTHPDEARIPGGETFREVQSRAETAVKELVKRHPGETIAVVSHGGTIRTLLCAALNIHLNYLWNIRQDNTAINILEYYEDHVMVSLVNDAQHLQLEK